MNGQILYVAVLAALSGCTGPTVTRIVVHDPNPRQETPRDPIRELRTGTKIVYVREAYDAIYAALEQGAEALDGELAGDAAVYYAQAIELLVALPACDNRDRLLAETRHWLARTELLPRTGGE